MSTMKKTVGDTEGYGSANTPSVTEKAVYQSGSDSQSGETDNRFGALDRHMYRHWERGATETSYHCYSISTQN